MTTRTHPVPPMLGAAAWTEAMKTDGYTCWCRGACGKPHKKTGGACDTRHDHSTVLIAAPETPTGDMFRDQTVPFLRAWCQPCYDGALRLARRERAGAPLVAEALFDLPGGAS